MRVHPGFVRLTGMLAIFAGSCVGIFAGPSLKEKGRRWMSMASFSAPVLVRAGPVSGAGDVRVFAYNLQNLFDTVDDPWTEDEEFLPARVKRKLSFAATCARQARDTCRTRNWTEISLELKLSRLAGVLEEELHRGPEVLLFSEVENAAVLRRLMSLYRPGTWKTIALLEGPDPRGIDTAVVSHFPLAAAPVLHVAPGGRTRGILEVRLRTPCAGEWVVFAFHFPSQLGSDRERRRMFDRLFSLVRERERAGLRVIAGGDSNMTMEDQRAWNLRERGEVAGGGITHFLGCDTCPGTYSYRGRWDFLDWIYFSGEFFGASTQRRRPREETEIGRDAHPSVALLDRASIRVPRAAPLQMDPHGAPLRFTEQNGRGVSDHFPIAANVVLGKCGQ